MLLYSIFYLQASVRVGMTFVDCRWCGWLTYNEWNLLYIRIFVYSIMTYEYVFFVFVAYFAC